jgi:hypothetical protein
MKASRFNWPAIVSALALILAVFGRWHYAVYVILRMVVCTSAVYLTLLSKQTDRTIWLWVMAALAVLFNPIVPVRMSRAD